MKGESWHVRIFSGIARSIFHSPRKWFVGSALVLGFLIAGLPRLEFVLDYTRFYTEDSPVTTFFKTFQNQFTGDAQAVWIMPETEQHAFHPKTLQQLHALNDTLRNIEGVENVLSLHNLELPLRNAFGYQTERLVRNDTISAFDSTRVMTLPLTANQLVSKSGRYPALVLQFEETYPKDSVYERLREIDQIMHARFASSHMAGRYWGEVQYNDMLQTETVKGIIGSVVVLIVMLWILFRRVGSIVLPAIAIVLGVLAFFGLKGWAGWPIDLLGVLFPPLLLIVGLSDVVHLYAKIQWKLHLKLSLRDAVKEAWSETGYATFLTSLTTGIGFMSLLSTKILPIRNFGWEAAWGVVMMFGVCIVVIPIFLRLAKNQIWQPRAATNDSWTKMGDYVSSIAAKRWTVPLTMSVVITLGVVGALRVESGVTNYWQIDPEATLKRDLVFFDEEFGGARYLDIGIKKVDDDYVDGPADFRVVEELTQYMRSNPAIGSVLSASDIPSALNMARFAGLPEYFELTESESNLEQDLDMWFLADSVGYHRFVSLDGKWLRISARLANVKTDSAIAIQTGIKNKLAEIDENYSLEFTGNSVLMDTTNDMLVENMFQSLALAFIIIAILMSLLFRSLRMLVLSLLPNVLPLLIALGVIGYMDIPLGTSTALILTIGFVIAVDDTIHYLMKFRLKMMETNDVKTAVKETNAQVGRALVLSSSVMLAAFIPQFFSAFLEQFYFAVVTSGVILSALVADLFLLPWLLLRFYRKR
ncbi:MMPL family transporter [Phaeocystidibacter luteus]|uniref:MMPL family transporter n=1 Tax=Phaeocystidibacter luteus TaxID=911197 RepID=A0A6N6RLA9_9FLAO|nr:MMPL family transporter [Phaeocystidibacter luteus]